MLPRTVSENKRSGRHPHAFVEYAAGTVAETFSPSTVAEATTVAWPSGIVPRRVVKAVDELLPAATEAICFAPNGVDSDSFTGASALFVAVTTSVTLPATQRVLASAVTSSSGAGSARTIWMLYVAVVVWSCAVDFSVSTVGA